MMLFRATIAVLLILGTTAADACQTKPLTRDQTINLKGDGFAFRGRTVEHYKRCIDAAEFYKNTPGVRGHGTVCFYDFKIEVLENFGRELAGTTVLVKDYYSRGTCKQWPIVGEEQYFLFPEKAAKHISALETQK